MGETVKFINSFMNDSANAMKILAIMLGKFVDMVVIDFSWICEQSKTHIERNFRLIPSIFEHTTDYYNSSISLDKARSFFW